MRFTKMHGIGNDYVYVDGSREHIEDPESLAKFVSDRHFGIGSDGLIIINPSECADFAMDMYNADGSRGKMCGNGIRCVGKYVYDHGLTDKTRIDVETLSGIKTLDLTVGEDGKVKMVRVDMGAPILTSGDIPVRVPGHESTDLIVDVPAYFDGRKYKITCISMGNPHCVVFEDRDLSELDLPGIGPDFENSEIFPERVNTEFVRVTSRNSAEMRVWERGSGETWACGTGACAAAVAAMLNGYTDRTVKMTLLGGDLLIEWDENTGHVFMTGPAEEVFEGTM